LSRNLQYSMVFGLTVWALVSLAAAVLTRAHPLAGLTAAALGGVLVGVLSARRVAPRRIKVRSRRRRTVEEVPDT